MNKVNTTDKAIKGAHSQTFIVAIKGLLSLVYFSVMSRLLTPDDFGYFALITAVTTIIGSISEAGLGSAVIQKKNPDEEYISTAYTLSLILGILFSLILLLGSNLFSRLVSGADELNIAFKLMSVILVCQSFNNITWALYMRKFDFFKFGVIQICADMMSYFIGIFFALKNTGFYAIVAASISNCLILTISLIFLGRVRFNIRIVWSSAKQIINYGGWLTAAVILRNLTNEIDKVIIGRMLPITDLGAINRPQGFVNRISTQINGIFDTVLFPILSEIQDDRDKIGRAYIKIVSLVTTLSIFISGLLSIGSKFIINVFFGGQWLHLQPILIIFSFAMMIHGYSRIADSFFRSLGIVKQYFWARAINWIIVITLVYIGCHFGIMGATICMTFGSFISCIVKYSMQKKHIGVSTKALSLSILRNITAPLIMLIMVSSIVMYFNIEDLVGIIMYVVVIFLTIILIPQIYGTIFRQVIINRYFKGLRKFQIVG